MGKKTANYRCIASRCYASISVKTETVDDKNQISQPIELIEMNFKHKADCPQKTEEFFKARSS